MITQESEAPAFARYLQYEQIYESESKAKTQERHTRMMEMQAAEAAQSAGGNTTPAAKNMRTMATRKTTYGPSAHTPAAMQTKNQQS